MTPELSIKPPFMMAFSLHEPMQRAIPAFALALVLAILGIFAMFESVYLRDQAHKFPVARVKAWNRTVRLIAFALLIASAVMFVWAV